MNEKRSRFRTVRRIAMWIAVAIPVVVLVVFGVAYARSTNECEGPRPAVPRTAMKAYIYCDYGPPDVLRIEDVEKPVPRDDEMLVRVRAVSVNPYDWHFVRGTPTFMRLMAGLRKPKDTRVGVDYAGVVEDVGRNVTTFKPGDEVFGGHDGAFAQYLRVRATGGVARKPSNITLEEAASIDIAGMTALQSVRDRAKVQPGQKVLINGASGGVGTFMVQIAKALGADVTGVCSTRNLNLVRSLGADHVVDYTKEDFTASSERYDVVLDNVGNRRLSEMLRVLKPQGKLILIGGGNQAESTSTALLGTLASAYIKKKFVSQDVGFFLAHSNQDDLNAIADLMQKGKVKPVIDRRYPFSQLPAALRYLEEGHARGKVVVTVD